MRQSKINGLVLLLTIVFAYLMLLYFNIISDTNLSYKVPGNRTGHSIYVRSELSQKHPFHPSTSYHPAKTNLRIQKKSVSILVDNSTLGKYSILRSDLFKDNYNNQGYNQPWFTSGIGFRSRKNNTFHKNLNSMEYSGNTALSINGYTARASILRNSDIAKTDIMGLMKTLPGNPSDPGTGTLPGNPSDPGIGTLPGTPLDPGTSSVPVEDGYLILIGFIIIYGLFQFKWKSTN